ncbi:hypothetical protein FDI40_gp244 [Agrobacterium phage Atu_ph07]|uniref:Uncharacterized protein n=1 Tax=Agrobacterium phage Atu_ph07 TaxID=2024264 RepID=A0A2L0UZS1_9CAUD|nr:hypothetical protein FDI40_gp244 [Agrobacterium phage Atu_ph07]AUZ95026.1 hypothetical protein [Agrobacterium phage Atu_ph07]
MSMIFNDVIESFENGGTAVLEYDSFSDYDLTIVGLADYKFDLYKRFKNEPIETVEDFNDFFAEKDNESIFFFEIETTSSSELKKIEDAYNSLENKTGVYIVIPDTINFETNQKRFHFFR